MNVGQSKSGALVLTSPYLGMRPCEMEDRIELSSDGRFRLLGRLDRIAKIEEKRVSLPEMENRLREHPCVADVALTPLSGRRQSLGAALVLNGEGRRRVACDGRKTVIESLRRFLADRYEAVLLPRHWRFLERIPLNERGKVSSQALYGLFAERDRGSFFPVIVKETRHEGVTDRIVLELDIRRSLAHFAGHFPEMAILPGVVQVDWAVRYARERFSLSGKFSSLEKVKFLAPILPDIRLDLSLAWDGGSRTLEFVYADSRRRYSAGRVVFGKSG
jgi:3-hydroxymyristoyl/3-hydroxydecanoyl-(acyl carrier protein) dehydratase